MSYPTSAQAAPLLETVPVGHMYDHETGVLAEEGERLVASAMDLLQASIFAMVESKGFHESNRPFSEEIALMHSELSEALESWRDNEPILWFKDKNQGGQFPDLYDDGGEIRKSEGASAELADTIVRIADSAETRQMSLAEALIFKLRYNATRPRMHGKSA